MKKLLLIPLLFIVACSHMTPYEACNQESNMVLEWQRYGSVEECVSEKRAEQARPNALQRFSQGFNQGYSANAPQQSPRMHCTKDYSGGYNCE